MAARPPMSEGWSRYYAATGEAPRDTLLDALGRFEAEGKTSGAAVDLGCGSGRDTLELLRRDWRVVAIDSEPVALEQLRAHPDAVSRAGALETVLARFEDAAWPAVDLVNASLSLPFCAPAAFERTWEHIQSSLNSGRRFCGHLFGQRDEWAGTDAMTFHSRVDVERLVSSFDVERLDEIERDGQTAAGEPHHHHFFALVVRSP